MIRWQEFERQAPEIARSGRERLYQFGPGLAFLATVRGDGAPRVHPVCANVVEGGLYLLIVDSPKRKDLLRDGRFSLQAFPPADRDDEFYLAGRAVHVKDAQLMARVEASQKEAGGTTAGDELLFELHLERALYARYKPRGDPDGWPPTYLRWNVG